MKILVLNAGSSSLKFDLFDSEGERRLLRGSIDRVADMQTAFAAAYARIAPALAGETVGAVGHRFVTGGPLFTEPLLLTPGIAAQLEGISGMAPLHMPRNLAAYEAAAAKLPGVSQVAVFDTAFHSSMPPVAALYAIPQRFGQDYGIRKYGFHGISHRYVSSKYAELRGVPLAGLRLIACHLGNGCSAVAIRNGRSIDTSMGFTPLEGLIMGTRCGDIDAGALLHLIIRGAHDPVELEKVLNSQSGLLGLSGLSNDMRDLHKAAAEGHAGARLAIDSFCYRVRKYIGSYLAALNGADALLFTGGIGENDAAVRAQICEGLSALGIVLHPAANQTRKPEAFPIGSGPVDVWVIPTDEELLIARDTLACIAG